ncbi:MAG: LAGLIDADG family homing endonuclease [Candidatus Omnitrophica bacterium]|jgi:hypothetical protein|nr:LAGLIDADG family homing endonuclease [Candidatus Omnitrophota bacterium]
MYNKSVINLAKKMKLNGSSISEISRKICASRSAIKEWVTQSKRYTPKNIFYNITTFESFTNNMAKFEEYRKSYYYLLGQYLGDGCISLMKNKRTYELRIMCADSHPMIIEEVKKSLNIVFPYNKIQDVKRPGCRSIGIYCSALPQIFPHTGKGKKHNRIIKLIDWQLNYLESNKIYLLKGLFHSDGSYYYSKATNNYHYNFTNCSLDIHNIFQNCLESLNIRYTFNKRKCKKILPNDIYLTIIYRKSEVDKLFELIGPK